MVVEGTGLNIQYAQISGAVFLTDVNSNAMFNLSSATVKGQLAFIGSSIGVSGEQAVFAQSAKFFGGLIWKKVIIDNGTVTFDSAHIHILSDDPECWPKGDTLNFDGMTYDRIAGAPTDAKTRLEWLLKGTRWKGEFYPQPYTQLAKVLYDMGHDKDARLVLEKREELVRQDERKRFRTPPEPTNRNYITALSYDFLGFLHWAFIEKALKHLIGYGHRPFKSIGWLIGLWVIAVWLSHMAWTTGDFAPTSAVLQTSEDWQTLAKLDNINPAEEWSTRKVREDGSKTYAAGQDWSTFSSFAYAADLVIPIINLGQTDTWGPSTERGKWGKRLWRYGFMLQIFGWIVTALGAAAITGLIRRD